MTTHLHIDALPAWREVVFSDGFKHRVADGVHEYFSPTRSGWCKIQYTNDADAEHFIELRANPCGEPLDVLRAIRDEIAAVVAHAEFGAPESVRAMIADAARDIVARLTAAVAQTSPPEGA